MASKSSARRRMRALLSCLSAKHACCSRTAAAARLHDAIAWNRGWFPTGTAECPEVAVVAEWTMCWPPIAHAIAEGTCIAYAFGVASTDHFTTFMSAAGCQVFAFDPSAFHPPNWMPNVKFHHWGLKTGAADLASERNFSGIYGTTERGLYLSMKELTRRLGHSDGRQITIMKMDCEGCEWEVWREIHSTSGPRGLERFGQVLTELHFAPTLRYSHEKAKVDAPLWSSLVANSNLVVFANSSNPGSELDRKLDEELVAAGFEDGVCCRELSLIRSATLAGIAAGDSSTAAHQQPAPYCNSQCMRQSMEEATLRVSRHIISRLAGNDSGLQGKLNESASLVTRWKLLQMPTFAPALLTAVSKRSHAARGAAKAMAGRQAVHQL